MALKENKKEKKEKNEVVIEGPRHILLLKYKIPWMMRQMKCNPQLESWEILIFNLFFLILLGLIYNVALASGVHQIVSVIHIHILFFFPM